MMTLVLGGSGSGKSAYAEELLCARTAGKARYYIATMQVRDAESMARVRRHQMQRSGRGFLTLEQPVQIKQAAERLAVCGCASAGALLECVSNLVANEMFAGEQPREAACVAEAVVSGIAALRGAVEELVIVGNNVFADGVLYDAQTMAYVQALGQVQERLAQMADEIVEVVVGVPVVWK